MSKPALAITSEPEIKITEIGMSDSLAPHHLLIIRHLKAFFPKLQGFDNILSIPVANMAYNAGDIDKGRRPLFVFSTKDNSLSPLSIADFLLAGVPLLTVDTDPNRNSRGTPTWSYYFRHVALYDRSGRTIGIALSSFEKPSLIESRLISLEFEGFELTA